MNRAAVIEQIKATQETLSKLLALLESSEADNFVAQLYQARKQNRLICERPSARFVDKRFRSYAVKAFFVLDSSGVETKWFETWSL
jgi:hypothetical protein